MFPEHKRIRLKNENRKIRRKSLNTWKLNICGSKRKFQEELENILY